MFSVRVIVIVTILGITNSQAPPDPAVVAEPPTPTCDVISAVHCFGNMESIAQPHTITGNPLNEIYKPCVTQIDEMSKLRECLSVSLAGCTTIYNDANKLISAAEYFCKIVTDCEDFSTKYKDSLSCVTNMFVAITAPTAVNSSAENCRVFATCLQEKASQCDALPIFLVDHWKLFEGTCTIVNVSRPAVLETQAAAAAPQMACPQLQTVTMAIYECHVLFRASVNTVENVNITAYCGHVKTFETCVNTSVAVCPTASNFQNIFTASMKDYLKAIRPVCGEEEAPAVCDTGHIKVCFENIDANMWKLENYVVEGIFSGITNETDLTDIISRAKQMTGIAKDLAAMCSLVNESVTGTENCTADQIAGCPTSFTQAFQANTHFLKNLCADFEGCTDFSTVTSASLNQCSEQAASRIKGLAAVEPIDPVAFRSAFCSSFNTLIACMKSHLTPCNISSENILALYEMLAEDMQPMCTDADFTELDNVTLSEDMEQFIDCRDLPEMSYELGMCHNTYLHVLAQFPTKVDDMCTALTAWEQCTWEVTADCDKLLEDMRNLTDLARNALIEKCPRPTTPPPVVTEMPTIPPTITDDAGNVITPTEEPLNSTAISVMHRRNTAATITFAAIITSVIGMVF